MNYPYSGGYMDQPVRVMWILDIFLDEYRVVLKEQQEASLRRK